MRLKLLVFVAAAVIAAGCSPSAPRVIVERPEGPLVVLVGGLGRSQLDEAGRVLASRTGATVITAGDWNGYAADVAAIIRAHPRARVFVFGHSLGGDAIAGLEVETKVLVDPVGTPAMPADRQKRWELYRPTPGLNHNTLAHDPRLLDRLVELVNSASS
jgi:pimeloyl-ACP methyl ester carboxylesterase